MAEWSIWKALEEWRNRRHELDPLFARAGIAPEVESAVNMVCVNLRRQTPTPPLLTGDKTRDEEEFGRYHDGYYRHFDDSLLRAETLLRLPWVPETAPLAERIRAEITRLRQVLREHPGRNPGCDNLEKLLRQYVALDLAEVPKLTDTLAQRRRQLTEIAGYPLLVQHAGKDPSQDGVPPLSSDAFRQELFGRMGIYRETSWLHNRVLTHAYVLLALDSACASKKRDALDDSRLARMLKRRWPTLSILWPDFEQADQIWYLLLALLAIVAVFTELWWVAVPMIAWLNLSVGAHRREKKEVEALRAQLVERMKAMKRTRDRFAFGQFSLEKLAFQLRQLDGNNEYFDEVVYQLAALHQHEA
ncbi:MAG: hypothetical protein H6R07_3376 [Proteobacteria bacterium]|nr:hypothetical protein [Pseudomonadota bacterium]